MAGFGETVEGMAVPVLNEREVRAAAGMLFLATFLSLMFIMFRGNFVPIKVVIPFFLGDFLLRVLVSPRVAPTLVLARLIVGGQTPEWVAAKPKRLAWTLGVLLAGVMFVMMVLMNTYSPVTGIICLLCLIFLFCESAFGICLGCKLYPLVYREKPVLCPGEVCAVRERVPAQRTTPAEVLVLLLCAGLVVAGVVAFKAPLKSQPRPILGAH